MNIVFRCFIALLFFLFLFANTIWAQSQIKEKIEIVYSLSGEDSIIRSQKTKTFDEKGRMITMQNYYYHHLEKGKLVKEEKSYYNAQEQVLTEHIIQYQEGKDPSSRKMVTQYLDYQPLEENSKRTGRQLYDEFGEMSREDTFTYDNNQKLIEQSDYDYRGNTSLFTNHYFYNKAGLQAKWVTYSKWTTINGKGEVVEKKEKRRDYRSSYNKNGQLTAVKGRYYLNRFQQKRTYDKNGVLLRDYTLMKRKVREPGTKEKPTPKKYRIDREEQIIEYQDNCLIRDVKLFNKVELNKTELSYQDTLVKTITISAKGLMVSSSELEYNKNNLLSKKTETKYGSDGKPRYAIVTSYNEEALPILEEQIMGEKSLSRLETTYDSQRNPLVQSLSLNNGRTFEKTMYIYMYY